MTLILADVALAAGAAMNYGVYYLKEYYKYTHENAGLYDEYYVDGKDVGLTFAEKRDLIYIFLESLETSYADKNTGAIIDENYIAELTELYWRIYVFPRAMR